MRTRSRRPLRDTIEGVEVTPGASAGTEPRVVPADELRAQVTRILVRRGVAQPDAEVVAAVTVDADLDGRATHGVARIPAFVEKLEQGGIVAGAAAEVVRESGSTFVIDGHDGFGQVALMRATRMALERSRGEGVAMGSVRNTNNPGMLAAYGRVAIDDGQIAILGCNAAPAMPPPGGAVAMLGTNPLCIAIPARDGASPLLDMATSAASKGAIRDASRRGQPIPRDWAVDRTGAPTTDPDAALDGLLLPAGGVKGAGLSMMVDLLAGLLAGGASGAQVRGLHGSKPSRVSAFVLTIDPAAFGLRDAFDDSLRDYLAAIHATDAAPGVAEVLVPGDRAWRARVRGMRDGLAIGDALWRELEALA